MLLRGPRAAHAPRPLLCLPPLAGGGGRALRHQGAGEIPLREVPLPPPFAASVLEGERIAKIGRAHV